MIKKISILFLTSILCFSCSTNIKIETSSLQVAEQYIEAWDDGDREELSALFLYPGAITKDTFEKYERIIDDFEIEQVREGYVLLKVDTRKLWLHSYDHIMPDFDERWLMFTPDGKIKYDSILIKHPVHKAVTSVLHLSSQDNEEWKKRIYTMLVEHEIPLFGLDLSDRPAEIEQSVKQILQWLLKEGDQWDSGEPYVFLPEEFLRAYRNPRKYLNHL